MASTGESICPDVGAVGALTGTRVHRPRQSADADGCKRVEPALRSFFFSRVFVARSAIVPPLRIHAALRNALLLWIFDNGDGARARTDHAIVAAPNPLAQTLTNLCGPHPSPHRYSKPEGTSESPKKDCGALRILQRPGCRGSHHQRSLGRSVEASAPLTTRYDHDSRRRPRRVAVSRNESMPRSDKRCSRCHSSVIFKTVAARRLTP